MECDAVIQEVVGESVRALQASLDTEKRLEKLSVTITAYFDSGLSRAGVEASTSRNRRLTIPLARDEVGLKQSDDEQNSN